MFVDDEDVLKRKRLKQQRQKQIARLRAKRRAGQPLDMKGHPEDCLCYDCLWGDNRELRRQAMVDTAIPVVRRPHKRGKFHAQ